MNETVAFVGIIILFGVVVGAITWGFVQMQRDFTTKLVQGLGVNSGRRVDMMRAMGGVIDADDPEGRMPNGRYGQHNYQQPRPATAESH